MTISTFAYSVLTSIAVVAGIVTPCNADEPRKRPNLLIVTADDMNADTPGWMGDKLKVTPKLDAFAATAHRFVNAHVTAPICQPSRSAFMTGLVPHRSGALGFDPVRPGTPTLVTMLKSAGYHTAVIEKHVHMQPEAEFPWDLKLSGGGKNPPVMRQQVATSIKAANDARKPFFLNANITDPHRPFPGAAGKNGKPKNPGSNARTSIEADKEPENAGVPAAPQHVYTSEQMTVPSFLEDIPALRAELAQYYTAVGRLDVTFNQIMEALRESGHADDTVVVFMSDHGISMPFAKATVYFNGTRSPILLRWPGMGEPQTRKEYVSSLDLMPTVLELLAVEAPEVQDGRSLLPLLRGETQTGRDHVITHVNTVSSGKSFPQRCIRTETASLMFMSWPEGREKFRVEAMSGEAFKAMLDGAKGSEKVAARVQQLLVGSRLAYYDLKADPDERVNLARDPAYKQDVERLAALLLQHMKRTCDPETDGFIKSLKNHQLAH
ncbi:sulfatase family protein [Humisphaera borealis]|uniref:Sulfatase n=1 Tax=Humisphaera borealis TaxID=2807512 RepID=A0A7M2X1I1_9BACT|nr:sulfatase [Humisphaera borealis]QOV90991.1 sulfatase [Humisphaera borealis]